MKVVLIALYSDVQSIGVRILSSCLKKAGHTPVVFYLCGDLGESTIRDLIGRCSDANLVGVSLMTGQVFLARKLTSRLKESLAVPIIWGGVHPTICPEECLRYADMVCVGEGEQAFTRLVDNMEQGLDPATIPGIWTKRGGQIVSHGAAPLIDDLDTVPFADYELDETYVFSHGTIRPMSPALLQEYIEKEAYDLPQGGTFGIVTSRGCPYACSYCGNNYFRKLHGASYRVRYRSIPNVIQELIQAKRSLPFLKGVRFHDDVFVARSVKELNLFRDLFKREIRLPFACYVSPREVTREKLQILCDAGMIRIGMGIQTGSSRTMKLYRRPATNKIVLEAANTIQAFRPPLLPPWYDFITDCPYETDDDYMDTFRLLGELPKPHDVQLFSMVLFPGTELLDKAKADGLQTLDDEQTYGKSYIAPAPSLVNFIFYCHKYWCYVPGFVTRWLCSKPVFGVLNSRMVKPVFPLALNTGKRLSHFVKRIRRHEA